jgi:hypothetical protein
VFVCLCVRARATLVRVVAAVMRTSMPGNVSFVYCILGNAYLKMGGFSKSITYHKELLAITKKVGNRAGGGAAYGNLGIAYEKLRILARPSSTTLRTSGIVSSRLFLTVIVHTRPSHACNSAGSATRQVCAVRSTMSAAPALALPPCSPPQFCARSHHSSNCIRSSVRVVTHAGTSLSFCFCKNNEKVSSSPSEVHDQQVLHLSE